MSLFLNTRKAHTKPHYISGGLQAHRENTARGWTQGKETGGLLHRDWWFWNTNFSQVKETGNFSWKIKVKVVFEWLSCSWRNFHRSNQQRKQLVQVLSGMLHITAKWPNDSKKGQTKGRSRRWAGHRCSGKDHLCWQCRLSSHTPFPQFPGVRLRAYKDAQHTVSTF